jgi:hypothetical protein
MFFFLIDENKLENVNKGSWRVNKYVEFLMKNDFDE